MKPQILIFATFSMFLASGCDSGPKSSRGFTLPDGNADAGKDTFVALSCHECHTVSGVDLPAMETPAEKPVAIGGEVSRIQTYGELVTSIINPSHKLAAGYQRQVKEQQGDTDEEPQSPMKNYNDVMTVGNLIDLVAFLQSRYTLKPYEPTPYDMYHYGP